jgi:hypothetical protein
MSSWQAKQNGKPSKKEIQMHQYSPNGFSRSRHVKDVMEKLLSTTLPGSRACSNRWLRRATAASPLRSLTGLLYVQLKNERASEQKRADQMCEQLEALKEVERTIVEREQESQPRRR